MKKTILYLSMLLAILVSCSNDNTTQQPASNEIWPLKAGNTWITKITDYDSLGTITKTILDTITVLNDTTANNEKIFFIIDKNPTLKNPAKIGAVNRSDGYHNLIFSIVSGNVVITDYYQYNYPAKVGDSINQNETTTTVLSTDTVINTGLGSYHCYKYNKVAYYGDNYNQNVIYLSPNNGFVYSEFYYSYKNGIKYLAAKHELISHIIN